MIKHLVKDIGSLQFSGSLGVYDPFLGALCPSKSGLLNKHTGIVKHILCILRYGWDTGVGRHRCLFMSHDDFEFERPGVGWRRPD